MPTSSPTAARADLPATKSWSGARLLPGAFAGVIATLPMTVVMLALYRSLTRTERGARPSA